MKTILYSTIALFSLACLKLDAEELEYKPGTEEWSLLYKPDFKSPQEIPAGSELRKELFDLARPKLEAIVKQKILFKGGLKAYRNWALFQGSTVDEKGNLVHYPDEGTSDTVILWLRTVEGWKVVDFSGGHGDMFYIIWPEQFGMPKKLLEFL